MTRQTQTRGPELEAAFNTAQATLLAPYAPHMTDEIWTMVGQEGSVHESAWPTPPAVDTSARMVTVAIQVNGKSRGTVQALPTATQDEVMTLARAQETIEKWITGEVTKAVYVPGRMLSLVVASHSEGGI